MLDHADYTGSIWQHVSNKMRNRSVMKDLDNEVGVDHTDHTDHLSEM